MDTSEQLAADARGAVLDRRADRARELMHAAEVVLLGHDDGEQIRLQWQPGDFRDLPGVRSAPALPARSRT